MKASLLKGDYKEAIREGERLIAGCKGACESEGLYYLLGLSYLKDGNYLRASDIFEIILNECKAGTFKEEARLGLGDAYFYLGSFDKAKKQYEDVLNNAQSKLGASVYYRLAQVALKQGDTEKAKEYFTRLRQDFPESPEARLNDQASSLSDIYYTVQVGSFSSSSNSRGLLQKLTQKGYPAYIEESRNEKGEAVYRVRVGRFQLRSEVLEMEKKLSQEGYPTKIFP